MARRSESQFYLFEALGKNSHHRPACHPSWILIPRGAALFRPIRRDEHPSTLINWRQAYIVQDKSGSNWQKPTYRRQVLQHF